MEIDSLPAEIDEVERRIMQLEIERHALSRKTTTHPAKGSRSSIPSLLSCARSRTV